ncbi:Rv3654c family TadE-like protein [Sphaerisporangium sp. B11E5]|uniref:Rv3654c family TadE-like protein n=1 Tax=Sphaerisporangium sp. B11E5 TaxID=3153563 RepID=UPI00325E8F07
MRFMCSRGPARCPTSRRDGVEKGSGTVWLVSLMALIWLVAGASVAAGAIRVARHRAETAADLSALAGAVHALAAPAYACRRAASVATANHAGLARCTVHTGVIHVRVAVTASVPLLGRRSLTAEARAGPR